jgi:cytidyltransferase-like protein
MREDIQSSAKLAYKLCKKLDAVNIKIWLAYGSSLGAVRDGGFVSGDYDIDLMIWKEDFDRFKGFIGSRCIERDPVPPSPPFTWQFRVFPNGAEYCKIEPTNSKYHIDIFPLSRSSDGVRCYNDSIPSVIGQTAKRWTGPRLHKLYHFENLKKIKFEGLGFYISKYAEETLDFLYNGADGTDSTWREPVSYSELNWDKNISRDKDDKVTGCVMGVFDLFHIGHLRLLERSSRIFTKVIAAVHPDEIVTEYKKRKPVIPYRDRVEIIKSCRFVDEVIEAPLRPHTVKWLNENSLDYLVHGKTSEKFLKEHYGEIIDEKRLFLLDETKDYHTTDLINKIIA